MSNKKKRNKEMEVLLSVFSNDPLDEAAYQTLQMFYKGAIENSIGLMRALNMETHETELLLVGCARNAAGGIDTYPLAKVLKGEEVSKYLSPTGKGGWFDPEADGAEEAEPMDFSDPEPIVDIEDAPTVN